MQYLDKALSGLRDLGLMPETGESAPIVALLDRISDLDEYRVLLIARTLDQATLFNEVVREQVRAMEIGERYEVITEAFDSIRDDAKSMVEQLADGKIDTGERLRNLWMKETRGDIAARFDKIKATYLDVAKDTRDQIQRERRILEAYQDFRGAWKQAEVMALEVLQTAESALEAAKTRVDEAMTAVESETGDDQTVRARLELTRDERLRDLQRAEESYQIAKDLSDNLTVGYNTSEVVMARLVQTTNAKDRIYAQSVSFFGTNETVLTALSASFTGLHGLHESTRTLEAMQEGVSRSLEDLGRDRRPGTRGGLACRLWPQRAGRGGEDAGRLGRLLPGPLARDHRRDARHGDPQLGRDPRGGRRWKAAPGPAGRTGRRARSCLRRRRRPRGRRRSGTTGRSTTSCWPWTWSIPCATAGVWSKRSWRARRTTPSSCAACATSMPPRGSRCRTRSCAKGSRR
jgi:hypothetical protein